MNFILATDKVYNALYEKDSHKHIRINDHRDLVGFHNIHVIVHEGWEEDMNDERIEYLAQQLEALADFGYIKLAFVDDDGWTDNYESPVVEDVRSAQRDFIHDIGVGYWEGVTTAPSVTVEYVTEDDGCAGGACKI